MKNIIVLGGGVVNGVFVVQILVTVTGKEYLITGSKAERFIEKMNLTTLET
jgi:hypothetical protein